MKKTKDRIKDGIFLFVYILMAVMFVPVFLCVIFAGNNMNYSDGLKLATLLPNWVLFLAAFIGMGAVCFLLWLERDHTLSLKGNRIANMVFVILFVCLYFVNVRITREIAFQLPWDIMVVRSLALEAAGGEKIGYFYYLSIYSNNIPIVYILGKLCKIAQKMAGYPYVADFIWMQVNCALFSIGGCFSCLLVKKLTRRIVPSALAFILYLALLASSPWKMAPYTDTYGMVFPVMCIYFYVSYRNSKKTAGKYLYLTLSLAAGMLGGFVKPSIYLVVIAVVAVEVVRAAAGNRKERIFLGAEILLILLFAFAQKEYKSYIIDEIGLDFNEELEADWQHYFMMGLNEENTGAYNSADAAVFGEFQFSKADRQAACIERAAARLKERGLWGTIWFWLRKMTMVFNDGSFGWECEVWANDYYHDLSGNSAFTALMRDIFWPDSRYTGRYNTFCQLIWIFCMAGFMGIGFCKREEREQYVILAVAFLGIFLYQMFFEARARYLFVFSPLLLAVSVCGMSQYCSRVNAFLIKFMKGKPSPE